MATAERTKRHEGPAFDRLADFVLDNATPIPESALAFAAKLLLDTVGVAAAATTLEAGKIARQTSLDIYGAGSVENSTRMMFDGRTASTAGAAFAASSQIDNFDAHDGYNPTRGHIGCAVVPALLAFAERKPDLTGREALAAMVIAYEVAARAGLALHATVSDYHTSGAWNALGVAALGCRLAGTDAETLRQALGIAEYHGPRSQMMREIDNPTMLHDGSGMGALVGVSAVSLAKNGFAGAPAITVEADEVAHFWRDLGDDWTIEKNYIKPYPICRWAHAAIHGAERLRQQEDFAPDDVRKVTIRTFRESSKLYAGTPRTTSEAQYALPYPVAVMLVHGKIAPAHVTDAAFGDEAVAAIQRRIEVVEDERHSRRFPEGRWSDVTIELAEGRLLHSGDINAPGGPEAPMSDAEVREKFRLMSVPPLTETRSAHIWAAGETLLEHGTRFADFAELVYPPVSGTRA